MTMPQSKRRTYDEPGHAHELTFSCYHGFCFLAKDRTRIWLAEAIEQARRETRFDLWAWVFMPEHVHLVIRPNTESPGVAAIRREIKQPVARRALSHLRRHAPHWLDRLAVRRGDRTVFRFWQKGAGYDRNVTEPKTLLSMIDYLHLNPVRRGLVERATDWEWSSARQIMGGECGPLRADPIPPEWLVE